MKLKHFEFRSSHPKEFFVTGIGTDVGKTFAAGFIAKKIISAGYSVSYMKTVQTGVDKGIADTEILKKISPEIIVDKKFSCPYSFRIPASPHFAAMCENRKIRIDKIIESFRSLRKIYRDSILLVEGAGGIMAPLSGNFLFINLIKKMKIPVILVSSPYLGAINHSLLSIHALKNENIAIAELVFSLKSLEINKIEKNTIETIVKFYGTKNFSIIPPLNLDSQKS